MDIPQLLLDLGVVAGILLFGLLAVVPVWLDREAGSDAQRLDTQRQPRGGFPTSGPISRTVTSPMSA